MSSPKRHVFLALNTYNRKRALGRKPGKKGSGRREVIWYVIGPLRVLSQKNFFMDPISIYSIVFFLVSSQLGSLSDRPGRDKQ